MAELKTKVSSKNVKAFLRTVEPEAKRADSLALLALFETATGEKAKLWGTSLVGFGSYHYESSRSAQKGDWPLTGFAPRKQSLTLYIMPGFKDYSELLAALGPHKTSASCLYIKRLADVDVRVLKKLIGRSVADMKKRYPSSPSSKKAQ